MMWLLFQKQIEKLIELSELYILPQMSEKHLFYFCYTTLTFIVFNIVLFMICVHSNFFYEIGNGQWVSGATGNSNKSFGRFVNPCGKFNFLGNIL